MYTLKDYDDVCNDLRKAGELKDDFIIIYSSEEQKQHWLKLFDDGMKELLKEYESKG